MYENAAGLLGISAAADSPLEAAPLQDMVSEIVREVMARLGR
jgi:hypothetical protein